jgi:hypothetical protein
MRPSSWLYKFVNSASSEAIFPRRRVFKSCRLPGENSCWTRSSDCDPCELTESRSRSRPVGLPPPKRECISPNHLTHGQGCDRAHAKRGEMNNQSPQFGGAGAVHVDRPLYVCRRPRESRRIALSLCGRDWRTGFGSQAGWQREPASRERWMDSARIDRVDSSRISRSDGKSISYGIHASAMTDRIHLPSTQLFDTALWQRRRSGHLCRSR